MLYYRFLTLASYSYNRLVFTLFPEVNTGEVIKKLHGLSVPSINLSFELSKALLDLSVRDRIYYLQEKLQEIISSRGEDKLFLYHIEILFEPSLESNPMSLLEKFSRMKTLLVQWPGEYDGQFLMYGTDGSRDYTKYKYSAEMVLINP
ncbi:MAG TPA: BREX-3 system P-loop-containing protein BrxF [Candidatus Eremiobacteraeota bacterium]|nr:BREX-3 system P-loop-containing protein BrxF [Candidatus Eremiobacteraeota bacterium]